MKITSLHLSLEKIVDMAAGEVLDAEKVEHLKACSQCEFEMARTVQLVDLMRTDETEDAPSYAIAAILRSFDEYQVEKQTPAATQSIGRRVRAILRLDSARLEPAYGFRSVGTANSRQLLFSTNDSSLDIRIIPADTKWKISGQVLGQITGGTIRLESDSFDHSADVDSRGEFSLPPVSIGTYRLRLQSENLDVEVPDLLIG